MRRVSPDLPIRILFKDLQVFAVVVENPDWIGGFAGVFDPILEILQDLSVAWIEEVEEGSVSRKIINNIPVYDLDVSEPGKTPPSCSSQACIQFDSYHLVSKPAVEPPSQGSAAPATNVHQHIVRSDPARKHACEGCDVCRLSTVRSDFWRAGVGEVCGECG